jgi:hypothetical protein
VSYRLVRLGKANNDDRSQGFDFKFSPVRSQA